MPMVTKTPKRSLWRRGKLGELTTLSLSLKNGRWDRSVHKGWPLFLLCHTARESQEIDRDRSRACRDLVVIFCHGLKLKGDGPAPPHRAGDCGSMKDYSANRVEKFLKVTASCSKKLRRPRSGGTVWLLRNPSVIAPCQWSSLTFHNFRTM